MNSPILSKDKQLFRISRSNDYANAHHHGNARDDRAHDAQQNLLPHFDEVIHHGNVRDDRARNAQWALLRDVDDFLYQ